MNSDMRKDAASELQSTISDAAGAGDGVAQSHSSLIGKLIGVAAVLMVATHIYQLFTYELPTGQFRNLHLGFALVIGFAVLMEKQTSRAGTIIYGAMVLASIAVTAYIHHEYSAFIDERNFLPNAADMVVATTLIFLALVLSGLQWGWTIPLLALLGLAYGYWGAAMPAGVLSHAGISFERLLGYSSIPYFQGLLGGLTALSASTIFMFMLFGGALKATGALDFIVKLGFAVGRRNRAGPAQVAVISSGLMGTISGSTVANVASTGAITIPLMKRYGFQPHFAGAVEAVASTGGQIMPPVLGLAAFLIVGITGIPYLDVMIAAIVPALIYYGFLVLAVDLRSASLGLDARRAAAELGEADIAREAMSQWHLMAAIVVLVYLLTTGIPAGTAALYAVLLLLTLDFGMCLVRLGPIEGAKAGLMRIVRAFIEGARDGASVATVIAVIGILVEVLSVTGFAQRLSLAMLDLADGRLLSLGLIVAMSCLVFGLGLPTSAAYFIVALFGAPALIKLGVPTLAAHMFVFYFANLSAITPPVAVAALVGANIAKANFWATALTACRLALPGFFLPFLFLYQPQILGVKGTLGDQALATLVAVVGTVALCFAIEGRLIQRLAWWERIALAAAAVALIDPNHVTDLVGGTIAAAVIARHVVAVRARSPA
ncbi:MAG: TRAP transporter fused permease subunit [Hyphomicrobiaceae bacterium]